ncbi:hypothetical protein FNH22_22130 [Fulvivirga sp. M361]|uniref:hypothetical protein n=1 Tax=Fulvivirga sp. M361 TaxID=2594266 RepID=UPI00117A9D66|nr:hypothetical protein [Fulvivirga sp. M361]TRX52411.1 hypothetical protein FNH22_22130 [Fulvivirga sp. M361]
MKVLKIISLIFFVGGQYILWGLRVKFGCIKVREMKSLKSVLIAVILGAIFSSCATYSCPTYSKETPKQEQRFKSV